MSLINQDYDEELNEIQDQSSRELQRRSDARQMYIEDGHPEPERKMVSFGDIVSIFGLEVILRVASTIGAALVSATAVGAVMEITVFKLVEAFAAQTDVSNRGIFYWSMLAFEGGLMASGMTAGRKNENISDSNWVTWAGFGVTITAGLLRSLTLLGSQNVEFGLSLLFGIVVGIAGPVISFYGSENFGYILKEIKNLQAKFDTEWQDILTEWANGFRAEYPRIAKQVYGEDRRLRVSFSDNGHEPQQKANFSVQPKVKEWLELHSISPHAVGTKPGDLVSPQQIAEEIADEVGLRDNSGKVNSAPVRKALERLRKIMS
jgi:hypothetical protein